MTLAGVRFWPSTFIPTTSGAGTVLSSSPPVSILSPTLGVLERSFGFRAECRGEIVLRVEGLGTGKAYSP